MTCTALHATSAELLNEVRILELVLNIQFLQDETENSLRYIDTLESYKDLLYDTRLSVDLLVVYDIALT